MTNVRNLDSPFWRSALSNRERRCIVPVTRFCEWTAEPDPVTKRKSKIWFGLHQHDDPLFAFAGIWRPGESGPYMAFLTCDANAVVGAVHPKAMPVILRASYASDWLDHDRDQACALAVPFPDTDMRRIELNDYMTPTGGIYGQEQSGSKQIEDQEEGDFAQDQKGQTGQGSVRL